MPPATAVSGKSSLQPLNQNAADPASRPKTRDQADVASNGSIEKETFDGGSRIDVASIGLSNFASNNILDINGPIYERLIIVLPYRAPDAVKTIESTFERINLECLGLESQRYLNTKELSDEEKTNRSLDYLCGFEIMDAEFRLFIIEGCGGFSRSIDQFYKANERARPNDKKFKMLYNSQVRFKNRIYTDFNVAMKRIKLRDTLT